MVRHTLALAIGLMCGLAGSQFPEFVQQYRQHLGGTVDELRKVEAKFASDASASGLTREQAIEKMRTASDDVSLRRAQAEMDLRSRMLKLEAHQAELKTDGPFARLTGFATYADADLTDRTLADFSPAMPVTTEGFVFATGGFAGGYLVVRILLAPFGRRRVARSA